jgi:hypothetical protein
MAVRLLDESTPERKVGERKLRKLVRLSLGDQLTTVSFTVPGFELAQRTALEIDEAAQNALNPFPSAQLYRK